MFRLNKLEMLERIVEQKNDEFWIGKTFGLTVDFG